jgi:hypothetical protein
MSRPRWQTVPRAIALLTVLSLVPLLIWDAAPDELPGRAHDLLAAIPLASIAVACLLHSLLRRSTFQDLLKSCALAAAFLFWSANQLWPNHPQATLFNDIAIALFVVDAFLAILGSPLGESKTAMEEERSPRHRLPPENAGEAASD